MKMLEKEHLNNLLGIVLKIAYGTNINQSGWIVKGVTNGLAKI
jgi:hypothetical protein